MFEESDVEDLSEDSSPEYKPHVRVPAELGNDASYAPHIMLFADPEDADSADGEAERRGGDRSAYDVAVYVHHDDEEFLGLCGDISPGGLFVATREAVPRGSIIELEFLLPDSDQEFFVEAEVRWVRDGDRESGIAPGFGVKFLDLDDDSRAGIADIIAMVDNAGDSA